MTATCTVLTPLAEVEFDQAVLIDICDRYGDGAEAHLTRLLHKIETLLALARMQVEQGHLQGLTRTCADLLPIARSVGMRSLERAALGVQDCLAKGDPVALAACALRLTTMGRPDVFHHWTVQGDTVA
ncbi:MAG: hypothetical protein AAGF30_02995 [Pseudomonadota bacterium]